MTISEMVQRIIDARDNARENKDYVRADYIRDRLFLEGVVLFDTKKGTIWKTRLETGR